MGGGGEWVLADSTAAPARDQVHLSAASPLLPDTPGKTDKIRRGGVSSSMDAFTRLTGGRASGWSSPCAASEHWGPMKLALLAAFVILATTSYMYVDSSTLHALLLKLEDDPYGALPVFLVLYTASVVVLFPCMVMQCVSGAIYGFWAGLVVSWVATSTGQSLAFLLGRYFFRAPVKSYLHSTWPSFPTIDAAVKKEGWKLVCLLRLSPVLPYNVLNYALAITPVSFCVFSAGSAVATIPWTCLYVYAGTFSTNLMDLAQGKIDYGSNGHITSRVLTGVFIAVTTVYGYVLSHRAINAVLKEVGEQLDHPTSNNTTSSSGRDVELANS